MVAYLDDVIVFDSDRTAHVNSMRALFERLRKNNIKLSPRRPTLEARMLIFWATPLRPPVYVRTRKKLPH